MNTINNNADIPQRKFEILAPAGGQPALTAALEAGADAVYFGLKTLNARRGAQNFHYKKLQKAVEEVHASGARAYLTLNIDLSERDTGQAVRTLQLALDGKVDAVLVRDPALLYFRKYFPDVEFHFSTQAGISSSAGAKAAKELGISRVVLARELSLSEISAASDVEGVETEVFIQGALCFSVSGRCLMSSWVGGRSGNRGSCTSPCRVEWTQDGRRIGRPFSMHDLCLLERVDDLVKAGVTCGKIEGRLKKPEWVADAVRLYRCALEGNGDENLSEQAKALGEYTGRELTSGYVDGDRSSLVGESGRVASDRSLAEIDSTACSGTDTSGENDSGSDSERAAYNIKVTIEDGKLNFACSIGDFSEEWQMPRTKIRDEKRALALSDIESFLGGVTVQGIRLGTFECSDPELLIPRKTANAVTDKISGALHRSRKKPSDVIKVDISDTVRKELESRPPHKDNHKRIGDAPNRARIEAGRFFDFAKQAMPDQFVITGADAAFVRKLRKTSGEIVISLPGVCFENELKGLGATAAACADKGFAVEVNSWDTWFIAKESGAKMLAGPGLMVLNSHAALMLGSLGMELVCASLEADRKQMSELSLACSVPMCVTVYGRPPLFSTRAELPFDIRLGSAVEDGRGVRAIPRREGPLTVFRPEKAFSLPFCGTVRAKYLEADLSASPDPVREWYAAQDPDSRKSKKNAFNFTRSLY